MNVAIIGAGGHGRVAQECLELIYQEGIRTVFYDDGYPKIQSVEGTPVAGVALDACSLEAPKDVFVAIGENRIRSELIQCLSDAGKTLVTILHPSCILSPNCNIAEGTIAISGSVANRGAHIGRGVILNTLSSVGHDCRVGDFAQLAPGVNLGGAAVIGMGVLLGIGAKVAPQVTVGEWTVVGAGSVVLDDLPPLTFCYGTPARVVRPLDSSELPAALGR